MWALDLFIGVSMAVLLYRAGLPSVFPLLLLTSSFPAFFPWPVLAGIVGAFFVETASFLPTFFPWRAWGVVFVVSVLGLLAYSFLLPFLPLFELTIPFFLLAGLVTLLVSSVSIVKRVIPALVLCLGFGFFVFEYAVIPFSLPAWLAGFFGLVMDASVSSSEDHYSIFHSVFGVFAGLLPGFGPGLVGVMWSSARALPFLTFTNSVFALGLVALDSRVRSFPAAAFSFVALPEWFLLLVFLFLALLVASLFRGMDWSFVPIIPSFFWQGVFLGILFLFGGLSTLLVYALAYALSRILRAWNVSPSLGLTGLIPSIFWFYSAGFF